MAPTYRRPDSLRRLLDGLAGQEDPGLPWDVLIVDNDPGGPAEAVIDAMRARLPADLRLVGEPRTGSAHARNRGIAEAGGEIIALIDDDVVPAPDWLARLIQPIVAGRCDGTGGRVRLDPSVPRPAWFAEEGIGAYLAHFDLGPAERALEPTEFVLTANAAFLAGPLRATGGFSPDLGPRGRTPLVCDDNLLTRKFFGTGATMRYVPDALVTHELSPARLQMGYLLRRSYAQGRSDWILDRDLYQSRAGHGLRIALGWLGSEAAERLREGPFRPAVAFHLATDISRTAGAVREMVAWTVEGLRPAAATPSR